MDEGLATNPFAYVQLGLLVGACILQVVWFFRMSQMRINPRAFGWQLQRLIAANNTERALKLCDATDVPATRLARAGIEARLRNTDAGNAMRALMPDLVRRARWGIPAVVVIGLAALGEGFVLFARGFQVHAEQSFTFEVLGPLTLLIAFLIPNALRWSSWERDLAIVRDCVEHPFPPK